jgi:hypothetical protein
MAEIRVDVSNDAFLARMAVVEAAGLVEAAMTRPSVLYRPALMADGTKWCALLGPDLQLGVAGFGDTPSEAMDAFDAAFRSQHTPDAVRTRPTPPVQP